MKRFTFRHNNAHAVVLAENVKDARSALSNSMNFAQSVELILVEEIMLPFVVFNHILPF